MLPHYSLAASDSEHARLVALATAEADRVVDACRRAGVAPGAVALDLGCGPLGAVAALAEVVGADGTVIGVDASAGALERARALMPVARFPSVRFIHADVHLLSPNDLGAAAADLAYSRFFLLHQRDPAATLHAAASFLRPGGIVIAHEPSDEPAGAPASEPATAAMTRVWTLVIAAARARGAQTDFGLRGRAYLERAGLEVVGHRAYVVHYPPHVGYDIPRVALHSLRPTLAEHGLATEAEIAELDAELEAAKVRPETQWVSGPLMFEWIGRTAGAEGADSAAC